MGVNRAALWPPDGSGQPAVAVFEFLPRPARTGFVAPRVAPGRRVGFNKAFRSPGRRFTGCGRNSVIGSLLHRGALFRNLGQHRLLFLFRHRPDLPQFLGHILAQTVQHV